jgi:hypothetical protein
MTKMPGSSYQALWDCLGDVIETASGEDGRGKAFAAKVKIARQLAGFYADSFNKPLRDIGNLYMGDKMDEFTMGQIVAPSFRWTEFVDPGVPQRPFENSREWMAAELTSAEFHCQRRLDQAEARKAGGGLGSRVGLGVYSLEELTKTSQIISDLWRHFDKVFPLPDPHDPPELTMIRHHNLQCNDVLIDPRTGNLTAVVD